MKPLIKLLLLTTLFYCGALLADTDATKASTQPPLPREVPALQTCPSAIGQRIDIAQVSQSDCCKGHKGVCGCRAGKIVCCDNTSSPSCTCHSDSGVAD